MPRQNVEGLFLIGFVALGGIRSPLGVYSRGPSVNAIGCKALDVIENHDFGLFFDFWNI